MESNFKVSHFFQKFSRKKEVTIQECSVAINGTHWRIQGGAPGTRAPPGVQILSFSCSFWQKCEK